MRCAIGCSRHVVPTLLEHYMAALGNLIYFFWVWSGHFQIVLGLLCAYLLPRGCLTMHTRRLMRSSPLCVGARLLHAGPLPYAERWYSGAGLSACRTPGGSPQQPLRSERDPPGVSERCHRDGPLLRVSPNEDSHCQRYTHRCSSRKNSGMIHFEAICRQNRFPLCRE